MHLARVVMGHSGNCLDLRGDGRVKRQQVMARVLPCVW
jgi:hypothetical protein